MGMAPPLACKVIPEMKPASLEARKRYTNAMSSVVPIRPTGICAIPSLITSSGIESVMSDLINPGATAFTVTPKRPVSLHKARVKPATAALVAA